MRVSGLKVGDRWEWCGWIVTMVDEKPPRANRNGAQSSRLSRLLIVELPEEVGGDKFRELSYYVDEQVVLERWR